MKPSTEYLVALLRVGAQDMSTSQRLVWKDEALRVLADLDKPAAVVAIGDHDPEYLNTVDRVLAVMAQR